MSTVKTYTQEWTVDREQHRLVCSDGRVTGWSGYQGTTYMDGYVGCTAFFFQKEGVYSSDEFLSGVSSTVGDP